MTILVGETTRLLCQGMTGWAGTYHTNRMIHRLGTGRALGVVDEFLRLATVAVETHGGEVHKIMGDKIVAVFGMTSAVDDAAGRAASAALTLRAEMGEWNRARAARRRSPLRVICRCLNELLNRRNRP